MYMNLCGHKLLNKISHKFKFYVSTRDPDSAIFLLKIMLASSQIVRR